MRLAISVILFVLFSTAALAQSADGQFIAQPRTTAGCNGLITSSAKLSNGDVIFGGDFTRCGNVGANRVVRFDGSNFSSIGSGSENGVDGNVRTLFVDGDKLYVGGHFQRAGTVAANNIAVFQNAQWQSVGMGSSNGFRGFVRAIQSFQGKLYVGGYSFSLEQFLWQAKLMEWDGTTWRAVLNFTTQGDDSVVNALEADQNRLYFGGSFRPEGFNTDYNVGSFDGSTVAFESLQMIGNTGRSRIRDLHFFQNKLCIAGSFTLYNAARHSGVACLQGRQWQGFGSFSRMRILESDGAILYAAGVPLETNGAALIAIGAQITYFVRPQRSASDYLLALTKQGDNLLFGGNFAQLQPRAQNLMRLQAGELQPIIDGDAPTLNAPPRQLLSADNTVYAVDYENGTFPAPMRTNRIHSLRGGVWIEMPQPQANQDLLGSLLVQNGALHFSGQYGDSTGLMRWNGYSWAQVGQNLRPDSVFQNTFIRFDRGPNGSILIQQLHGQSFVPWLVIPQLKRRGFTLNYAIPLTLGSFRGMPVLAGSFDEMEGVGKVGSVAIYYDNRWHPLGEQGVYDPHFYSSPYELIEWHNELYVSNGFTQADGQDFSGIARFDGRRWHDVGGGIVQTDPEQITSFVKMIVYQDKLYAYGNFNHAGGRPANHVAQWDGATWRTLGSGAAQGFGTDSQSGVNDAVIAQGDLMFSGDFHEAGGEAADFFAIWRGGDVLSTDGFE